MLRLKEAGVLAITAGLSALIVVLTRLWNHVIVMTGLELMQHATALMDATG